MTQTPLATGYGPSANLNYGHRRPLFDGDERKFEIWGLKFSSYLRIRGLLTTATRGDGDVDPDKNAEIFAELVQVLDDRSIGLIIRDARDDGRKALQILKDHYQPKGKANIITLYTELTSLVKKEAASVTDYIIRAETIAAALREAGGTISDGLLVAMSIKGLPIDFKPFNVVITQKDHVTSSEFKVLLRNFEDNETLKKCSTESESVMNLNHMPDNDNSKHN